jgi:sodium-dependent dicarboxylate transporter 2/3/5
MEHETQNDNYSLRKRIGLFAGPVAFIVILIFPPFSGMSVEAHRTFAVTALMAIWWLTEAISISATALIPLAFFPLLGIQSLDATSASYGDKNIYLFFGGFILAAAMEKSKLHLRIAYSIVSIFGRNPRQIIFGFMVATAFLSMWISNTATTLMMLPIALASIIAIEGASANNINNTSQFGSVLMLSIAYSSTIGGLSTLVGTPPNIVFVSATATLYPDLPEIGFLRWFIMAFPITIVLLPGVWLLLTRVMYKISGEPMEHARKVITDKKRSLGVMRTDERRVLIVFLLTAFGWIFRRDIVIGSFSIPGWSDLFPNPGYIGDATVAMAAAIILFITPVDRTFKDFLITWKEVKSIPWGILILFGGGIALAGGFQSSGLSQWIGNNLIFLQGYPIWLFIFMIALLTTFLTEFTSNFATTTLFMPIMGALAVSVGFHPYLLMLPAVLSASCAFMLPIATAPNAIVFGSGRVNIMQMARPGLIINLFGAVLITLVVYFIAIPLFNLG